MPAVSRAGEDLPVRQPATVEAVRVPEDVVSYDFGRRPSVHAWGLQPPLLDEATGRRIVEPPDIRFASAFPSALLAPDRFPLSGERCEGTHDH